MMPPLPPPDHGGESRILREVMERWMSDRIDPFVEAYVRQDELPEAKS